MAHDRLRCTGPRTGKPVGLGLAYRDVFGRLLPRVKALALIAAVIHALRSALSQAGAAGPAGLGVADRLRFARRPGWLATRHGCKELRSAFPQTPLAITALPDWLAQRDFAARLAMAVAGRFVLQAEYLVPDAYPSGTPVLCDGKLACAPSHREGEARIGVPFQRGAADLQLRTAGRFDAGRIVGVHAEDSTPAADDARRSCCGRMRPKCRRSWAN